MYILTLLINIIIWLIVISSEIYDGLKFILIFSSLFLLISTYEISRKKNKLKMYRRRFSYDNVYVKYLVLVIKIFICLIIVLGFFQWFNYLYNYLIWVIIHTIIVTLLLSLNLYMDIFKVKWYKGLNINITKDDFVQRKIITMISFLAITYINAFIVYLF